MKKKLKNQNVLAALAPLLAAPCALLSQAHQKAFMARLMRAATESPIADGPIGSATEELDGTICVLPVIGVLTRYGTGDDRWDAWCGIVAMLPLLEKLNQAAADPMIRQIVLDIDSPGGFVDGTCELADAIAVAATIKPVNAIVRGMCCSGAYWLASQCSRIVSRPESQVGNIGVYSVLMDVTGWYAQMGITTELISTGPYKGLGADGKISDALREETQRMIDGLYGLFTAAVSVGRQMKIDDAQALADGRAYLGNQAKKFGLVDAVATSFAAALQTNSNPSEEDPMAKATSATPASPAVAAPASTAAPAAAIVAPGEPAASAAPQAAASSAPKSAFKKATDSANAHKDAARAAMDAAGTMTDDPDDDTKSAAQACVSALESAADESNRAAEKISESCKLDDQDDPEDPDGDAENRMGRQRNKKLGVKAKDFALFGDAGYRMFVEGKSFAAAAKETIEALRAENLALTNRLGAIAPADRGNPAASAQAEPMPGAKPGIALPDNKSNGAYSDGSKYGDGRGLERYEAAVKIPTVVTTAK